MDTHSTHEISRWLKSVEEYIKTTKSRTLNLETSAVDLGELDVKETEAIFEFLKNSNSEISQLNLARNSLRKRMRQLANILSKTKIQDLNLELCDLTYDDLLSLMEGLNESQLMSLHLGQNQIRFEKEESDTLFAYLKKSRLRTLNLSGNFLSHASLIFTNLAECSITHLNLSKTLSIDPQLSSPGVDALHNLLTSLPKSSVKHLSLSGNGIKNAHLQQLGDCLEQTKLEELDLSSNNFDDSGVDCLLDGLVKSKVMLLNLSGNQLVGGNALGQRLKATQIQKLDLSKNELSNPQMFSEPNFLANAPLQQLKLGSSELSETTCALLLKELISSQVTDLDLSCNNLKAINLPTLAEMMTQRKITSLDISRNYLGKLVFTTVAENIKDSKIESIDLSSNVLKNEGEECFHAISKLLCSTVGSSVLSIRLSSNSIRPESAKIIAPSLRNLSITLLDLSHNSIGGAATGSLATELKFSAITSLDLSWNSIGNEGAGALANSLAESSIDELNLANNAITSVGARALASVLGRTKLHSLLLDFNIIENDGIEALAKGAENTFVTVLSVVENPGDNKLLIDTVLWRNRARHPVPPEK